jgi:hypothetical protein
MKKTVNTENTAPRANARTHARTRASDVKYVFHLSHRFFMFILGHLVKRIYIYSFKIESLTISFGSRKQNTPALEY